MSAASGTASKRWVAPALIFVVLGVGGLLLVFWPGYTPELLGGPAPLPAPTFTDEDDIWRDGKVFPASARVEQGVEYRFELYHCGIDETLDFDGSFWDPVGPLPNANWVANEDEGTMTLIAPNRARYESLEGGSVEFVRHEGPRSQKEIPGCA
ncbi:MAG: hypothetical protein M3198_06810 [Actinomycetota bacterium]|nr:hypothetical protein [Actinomycetota bacterium]